MDDQHETPDPVIDPPRPENPADTAGPVKAAHLTMPLTRGQLVALGFAAFVLLATALTGPYLVVLSGRENSQQLREIRRDEAGVQQLLQFVANVQTGPQAKANRDAQVWYVEQFRAICAGIPHCRQVPLPDGMRRTLGQPPPTPPTSAPSASKP